MFKKFYLLGVSYLVGIVLETLAIKIIGFTALFELHVSYLNYPILI